MAPTTTWLATELIDEISKEVSSGRYVNVSKLEEKKEHRFRFFGTGITGFEAWTTDNKPVRFRRKPDADDLPANIRKEENGSPNVRRFLASLVYDYAADDFKVIQMNQRTLITSLCNYIKDPEYGNPVNYDIKITRKGSGLSTEYTLVPSPPKDPSASVVNQYEDLYCNLEALFDGKDPFERPQG